MKKPRKRNGSKWICRSRRLAIYLRDGLACAYCGNTLEDGTKLTLDHLTPFSKGGSNKTSNLVTACDKCNNSRGTRPVKDFCEAVASYLNHGIKGSDIEKHIRNCVRRKINIGEAKEILARRNNFSEAMERLAG